MVAQPVWVRDDRAEFLLAVAASVPEWQRDAACIEHPGVEWFGPKGDRAIAARAICARCLEQSDCLAFALDEHLDAGIWGGSSAQERAKLPKRGITGAMVARFGFRVDQGRELLLDEASLFGGLLEGD
ncbi:MAG: WhiB family transcriptional regulator [Actinomycetota bacterium]|nr:WhiB family transcriptional regulator [Actinomycetota bacterium]